MFYTAAFTPPICHYNIGSSHNASAKIRKKKDNNAVLREILLLLFNPLVNTSYKMMETPLFDASILALKGNEVVYTSTDLAYIHKIESDTIIQKMLKI